MLDGCVGWPPDFVDRYRGAGYWQPRTLGELARHEARHNGDRLALAGSNCRLTYRALDAAADRVAAGLYRLGIGPRDRVVIQLPNVPQFVVVALALFRLGAVPVFVLPAHRRNEIQFLC
ncbi:MAG: AMP-binding protein, partial [Vicinamibacterales bacterium]